MLYSSKLFHGLSKTQVKRIAYDYAKELKKKIPASWEENKCAGEYWLSGFRKRNNTLSLRSPEATSLGRSIGFNRIVVSRFFEIYQSLLQRFDNIGPHNIWNLDETGISTVVQPRQVFAEKGIKQVGRITSAERGTTVTLCCCINAVGNVIPPVYVFPRVHFKDHMLNDAPSGSCGLAYHSGWMNSELFPCALQHFLKYMNVTPNNPGILVFDNHNSHLSIEAIALAKKNGLHLLTFPPKCSHRMQPLDVCVYGPFKQFYSSLCDAWMTSHPGRAISIYDVASISGQAFQKAFTNENIVSAFRCTGLYPFNPHIFRDDAFLPAEVTDRPLLSPNHNEDHPQSSSEAVPVETEQELELPSVVLQRISPYPKVTATSKRSSRKKARSQILTDTPNKEKVAVEKRVSRPHALFSCGDEEDVSALNSHFDAEENRSIKTSNADIEVNDEYNLEVGDFVVVKVYSLDDNCKNFIAHILDGPDEDRDFEVKFMTRSQKIKNAFQFPEIDDLASIRLTDIVGILPKPSSVAGTKRLAGVFKFDVNMCAYGV